VDLDGNCTFSNAACLRLLGYHGESDLLGRNMQALIHHTRRDGSKYHADDCRIFQAYRQGEGTHVHGEIFWRADGTSFPAEYRSYPIRRHGQVVGAVVTFLDMTQRRQAETALQQSELRFDQLLSSLDEVVWSALPDSSKLLYINPAAERVYGRPTAEFYGNSSLWLEVIHPDDRDDVEKSVAGLIEQGAWQHEYRIIRPDGSIRWISDRAHVVYDNSGIPSSIGGIATDITARKHAEESLHDREERYRHLVEMHPDAIAIHREGRYLYFNPAGAKLLGAAEPEQLVGIPVLSIVHPEFQASVAQRIEAVQKGRDVLRFDDEKLIRLDGKVIDVEITGTQFVFDGEPAVQITMRDITHRKQVEKKFAEQQAQLAHVARLNAMGEMVGGIAHEINQPLAAISNFAGACTNLITAQHDDWADNVLGFTRQISQQAVRCGDIIRRLGNFAKKSEVLPSIQKINDLVEESVELVASAAGKRAVTVQLDLVEPSPCVAVDGIQIQQVIVNILRNAYEAMHESNADTHHVTIRSRMTADCVEISIKDSGPGLPDDELGNLFDTFFTTKKSGMGVGLAISRSIIDSNGGRLWAESDPEIGATFYFTLPVVSGVEAHVS
jgi:two-component system sensor kinase FixL